MDVWTRHGGGIRSVRDRLDALEQSLGQRPRPDPQTCRSDKNSSLLRRQSRRRNDRRGRDSHPRRAAALNRPQRQRAGDGSASCLTGFMLLLASDRELMGRWASKRSTNVIGGSVIAFVAICGATYGIDSFLQSAQIIGAGK